MLTYRDVLAMPPAKWLVEALFEAAAFVILYGPPGACKTFLALSLTLAIAFGRAWHDYAVTAGPVVYVVGEGGRGIGRRVTAWLQHHQLADSNPSVFFRLQPVQLLEEAAVSTLLQQISALPAKPVLIVFDTFSMCFSGDENNSRDMNLAISAVKRIIRETGATVLLVHHTGKKGKEERGHSAMRAAADTMILVEADKNGLIKMSNTKQKDAEPFAPIALRRTAVSLGGPADDGEELTSCILEPTDAVSSALALKAGETRALAALLAFPDGTGLSGKWMEAINKAGPLPKRTFQNWRKALLEKGFIEAASDAPSCYRVTDIGRGAAGGASATPVPIRCHGTDLG